MSLSFPDNLHIATKTAKMQQEETRHGHYNPTDGTISLWYEGIIDKKVKLHAEELNKYYYMTDIEIIMYAIQHEFLHHLITKTVSSKASDALDKFINISEFQLEAYEII